MFPAAPIFGWLFFVFHFVLKSARFWLDYFAEIVK